MHADEKLPTILDPARHRLSRSIASLRSPCGRAWRAVLAAMHQSRAGEAARVIRRHRNLVDGSRELARMPVVAPASRQGQSPAPDLAIKSIPIVGITGFALIHGIAVHMMEPEPGSSNDASIVL